MPTALVLLAGEQLWPNIHSIEYWKDDLKRVLVCHTADGVRSAEPAGRLKQYCAERFGLSENKLDEFVTLAPGEFLPQAVGARIGAWVAALPAGFRVVLNATGGNKLMFDGASALRRHERVEVVYRELGPENLWFRLRTGADGGPLAEPVAVPAEVTDRIPVETLIRTLWQTPELPVSVGSGAEELDVALLTRELIAAAGDWRAAFGAAGVPVAHDESGGLLFERYVAAALRAFGLPGPNVACNVRQDGERAGATRRIQHLQQVDIVVNHGARLRVYDCKLRTVEEEQAQVEGITSQLRQAAATKRRLGGLSGEAVLLRPNRELAASEQALANDLQVRFIARYGPGGFAAPDGRGGAVTGGFFELLGRSLNCTELPPMLRTADQLLTTGDNVARAFPARRALHLATRSTQGRPAIDLERLAGDWARDRPGQDWAVARIRGDLHYLQFHNRGGLQSEVIEDALQTLIRRFGTLDALVTSGSGDTLFVLFFVDPANARGFNRHLEARVGASLLD